MSPPRAAAGRLRGLALLGWVLLGTSVGSACQGPHLIWDEHVQGEWLAAAERLTLRLASQPDVDRCATVELLGASPGVIVHITLLDGRSAVRRVQSVAQLEPVLDSLVLLPAPAAPAPAPVPSVLSPSPSKPEAPSSMPDRSIALEAGLGVSTQLTGSPAYVGYGATGFVQATLGAWQVGTVARWEVNTIGPGQTSPRGFNMQSVTLGVLPGRRFSLGETALDALLGPQLLVGNQEATGHDKEGLQGFYGDVSLGAVLRVSRPGEGSPHLFGALTAEVFPRRLAHTVHVDPALPALAPWGAGLALGLVWGKS